MSKQTAADGHAVVYSARRTKSPHITTALGNIYVATIRCEQIHNHIVGPLPISEGHRYIFTCVDRFTHVGLKHFNCVYRSRNHCQNIVFWMDFEIRSTITHHCRSRTTIYVSDIQATQNCFETNHLRTTAYHRKANGFVQRFHTQLKAAMRCHEKERWTKVLPAVLLGIRSA